MEIRVRNRCGDYVLADPEVIETREGAAFQARSYTYISKTLGKLPVTRSGLFYLDDVILIEPLETV